MSGIHTVADDDAVPIEPGASSVQFRQRTRTVPVLPDEDGSQIVLVASLEQAIDGSWRVTLDDANRRRTAELAPLVIVVRGWQDRRTGVFRGTIEHPASGRSAPFHTNQRLIALFDTWIGSR